MSASNRARHHRPGAAVPRIAPKTCQRMDVDVELGLAPQPVADALGYRVEDQRERLEQRFEDGFYRAGFRRGCIGGKFITRFRAEGLEPGRLNCTLSGEDALPNGDPGFDAKTRHRRFACRPRRFLL